MPIRRTVDGGSMRVQSAEKGQTRGCLGVLSWLQLAQGCCQLSPRAAGRCCRCLVLFSGQAVLRRKLTLGRWPITARRAGCGGEARLRHPSCPTALKEHQGASSATRAQPEVRSGPSTDTKHRRARRFSLQRALNTGPTRMSQHQQHRELTTPFILPFFSVGADGARHGEALHSTPARAACIHSHIVIHSHTIKRHDVGPFAISGFRKRHD